MRWNEWDGLLFQVVYINLSSRWCLVVTTWRVPGVSVVRRMIKEVEESKEHPMKGVVGSLTEENLVNLQLQEPTWGSLEPSIDELGQCPWKRCNFFCYPPCPSCHFTAFHFISLHFISLHFTSPHFTSLHFTSPHFTSLHLTSLHFPTLYSYAF